jgi:type 1 fimbriae regulatory protein FimB/type 1 fimbriae regulatory protein FimE
MGNPHLKLVVPAIEKRTVAPKRAKNSKLRTREYLTEHEVETLMAAARKNRRGHRDATMILVAFRHGLRASELVDLRWDQVDFNRAILHVRRAKGGTPSVHPLTGSEMRSLRRLQRESEAGQFVFVSERGAPFTTAGFARMLQRAATATTLTLKVHPHMLRHACGFALANSGSRYPRLTSLSRAQDHPAYGPLHRVGARPVQEILEGLSPSLMRI